MNKKEVLVTGGTQGIGESVVHTLMEKTDYTVHITYRSSSAKADALCEQYSGRLFAHKLDQGDPKAIETASFLQEHDWYGVVFNAALGSATVKQYAAQDGDVLGSKNDIAMLNVNALGPLWIYRMIQQKLEHKTTPSKLIFVSSVGGGITAFPKFTLSDGMSKCAVSFLARQLAAENTHTPIDVFSICPGATETAMFKASTLDDFDAKERDAFEKAQAKQRLIQPTEIAYWIEQLLRPESTVLHGANIDASMGLGIRPGIMTEANLEKN